MRLKPDDLFLLRKTITRMKRRTKKRKGWQEHTRALYFTDFFLTIRQVIIRQTQVNKENHSFHFKNQAQ